MAWSRWCLVRILWCTISFFPSVFFFFFSFLVYKFLFFTSINFTKLKQQPHPVTDRWCWVRILLSTPSFFSLFFIFFFFCYRFCFVLFCFVCLFVCFFFFNINLNSCYLIKSNTNKLCSNHPSFLLNFGVNYSCSFYAFLFHCNIFYKTQKVATRSHRLPFIFVAVVLVIRER